MRRTFSNQRYIKEDTELGFAHLQQTQPNLRMLPLCTEHELIECRIDLPCLLALHQHGSLCTNYSHYSHHHDDKE
ncbi:hypothetical protein MICAE_1020003 [Microcystis aeruginosa PCC 9806]|uniref:Uncharacterized protein n=1 Tax=Microcystis aeruginosa PCC 9806 TaxID=1160282 RepID=I4GQB8_MICAE|nr:hypothetical protein MICAE_1020003 [Microcystis aeruginosa PCC 9806]